MPDARPLEPTAPGAGTFLIASPRLLDPNFMHAVVLVCAHGPEGTHGLIVNRPGEMTVTDLGSDHDLLRTREDPVWIGGPVRVDTLQVLHRLGADVPGSLRVLGDLVLGGDPDVLRARMEEITAGPDRVRFVLGYSGWGEGQLEREIDEGSWVVCTGDPALALDPHPRTLWRRTLRALGGPFASLADEPPDPSWN